jgi:hypothetical protein
MKRSKLLLLPIILLLLSIASLVKPRLSKSIPSSVVSDTLSSSQLSYFARIGTGVSMGDSIIRVSNTANTAPSLNTANLFIGDTIGIGTTGSGVGISGPLTMYVITDIGNTQSFEINTAIGQSNAFFGAAVIATRSAMHTIAFKPQSNATSGFWQFLIKATSRAGEINNDGIPDQQGFDLGATTPTSTANGIGTRLKVTDVTCPNWGTGVTTAYSVGTTTSVVTAGVTNYYHVVTCFLGLGGTNQVNVGYSMTVGANYAIGTTGSQLINPSASTAHTPGLADTSGPDVYTFFVRHLDSSQVLIDADTASGKIAVVEAVRVTATIDPTLTFSIGTTDATNVGATPCGVAALGANAANTTATSVAFGSLNLSVANDLAQMLSCVTNANNGYVVTVYEASPMKNVVDGNTIPDTTCPSNSCTISSQALWTTYTASGWGYSIHNLNVGSSIFHYTTGYRPFGIGSTSATQIMKNVNTPSATERAYICYRIAASTTQSAGNYENKLIYTATTTF